MRARSPRSGRWTRLSVMLIVCLCPLAPSAQAEDAPDGSGAPDNSSGGLRQPVLPPLPEYLERDRHLSALPRIRVKRFRFEGNTVFSDTELAALVRDWQGRAVTAGELHEAQARLTRHYVENGYVTSGVLLPDQTVQDGVVTFLVVEGRISEFALEGQRHLRPDYITGRLATAAPLQVHELERKIRLLQRDPMVRRINAQVAPAGKQGENVLRVRVTEESPWAAGLVFDNGRSPSIGAQQLELWAMHRSVSGRGDRLEAHYSSHDGPDGYWLGYTLPLDARDTTLSLAVERNDALVVEAPYAAIDIESRFNRAQVSLRHPFLRTLHREFAMSLGLEWRHAETFLLNEPFSFASGVDNGESRVTLVHFIQEWLDRNPKRLFAVRSDIRWGVDVLGATVSDAAPDARYLAWLGQLQWVRRLPVLDSKLVLRGVAQLASDALLPSEKIAIGGMDTVRGYRENLHTTDRGMAAGIEWQVPVGHVKLPGISTGLKDGLLELAVFADYGRGSNRSAPDPAPDEIASVGLGMLWHPAGKIAASLYWGHPLRDVDTGGEYDLQDDGIHFSFSAGLL
jgi:hemolysin activation/secretion protein